MKTIVILSGGMDSSVLLASCLKQGDKVIAFSVNYGQRHKIEMVSAGAVAAYYDVKHVVADIRGAAECVGGSSLTSQDIPVPQGHYAAESMKATVVPNRNMILLALAGGLAISQKADAIAYGAHAGDHAIYPDCRPEFADTIAEALILADWHKVVLTRPFIHLSKAEICRLGDTLGVPMDLTYSCYEGRSKHCGKCGTCVERREAFALSGVTDPTTYEQ